MEITGKYVETEEYKKEVEKKGFKYSPATGSLFLSYPYLPKKFSRYAVKIGLYHVGISPISKINSVEYYERGSGYHKVDAPGGPFRDYAERILKESLEKSRPKSLLV